MKDPIVDDCLREALRSIYEEIMWLSQRPNVTPGRARAWYTHIMAESVKRKLRNFTGFVSRAAIERPTERLVLEHYLRIQTALTSLVGQHRDRAIYDPGEFIELVVAHERVHVVTRMENYAAMRAKGDYELAGIDLVHWHKIPEQLQIDLWKTMLRGKVANAAEFAPGSTAQLGAQADGLTPAA